jgi:hypothetical protein
MRWLFMSMRRRILRSLFVSGEAQPSLHNNAVVTSYLTENGGGDATNSVDGMEFTGRTTSMYWLKSMTSYSPPGVRFWRFHYRWDMHDARCT